jgi:methyltransferase (TIGR00027 family)
MEPIIQNISDTALWVAVFRADESERADAVFHDPLARRLAGRRGEDIANSIGFARNNSWSFVARTFLFDEFIRRHVDQGYDMVINLAAGLDTRPYRMALPPELQWVEIDFPGILRYKQTMLENEQPVCRLRSVPLDLSDRTARLALFKQLGAEANKILIVSEGLMIYLEPAAAGALAGDLSAQANFKHWVTDLQSPGLLAMSQKEMGAAISKDGAPFKFAPEEGEAFFLPHGWKNLESRSKLKTAATLNRLSEEMMNYAAIPEPEGPKGAFPWSGVCLFENLHKG